MHFFIDREHVFPLYFLYIDTVLYIIIQVILYLICRKIEIYLKYKICIIARNIRKRYFKLKFINLMNI